MPLSVNRAVTGHGLDRQRSGEQFEIWAKQKPLDSAARFLRFRAVLPNRG